jgi:hypothetical protein
MNSYKNLQILMRVNFWILDTDKSSESDFHDEENDMLLLDSGYDIVRCRVACVTKIMGSSSDDWIY